MNSPKSYLQRTIICISIGLALSGYGFLILLPDAWSRHPKNCDREPTGVETEDYWLDFETENMPDPDLNGLQAEIRVHRVKPVYANGKCPQVHNYAAVLIHGRSIPGSASFDLRHPTAEDPDGGEISLQENLAMSGIDTFAPDFLGYGLSSRLALDDPCNASLPAYVAPDPFGNCPANTFQFPEGCCPVAQGCDRTRNAVVFPLNQQMTQLGVNPLGDGVPPDGLCSHSNPHYFARTDTFARDILQVIDDVIARAQPKSHKVVLVGSSFGGPSTARALYRLGDEAEHKVKRVVFLASLFNRFPGVPIEVNSPTDEEDLSEAELSTSFPLSLSSLATPPGFGISPGREQFCSGDTSELRENLRQQLLALDPLVGALWGGIISGSGTGVLRSPTFTNYGWNPDVAATFTLPTLIMHGVDDAVVPLANSNNIFTALKSVSNKILAQVGCGSHFLSSGVCLGAHCDDGNPATTPYGQDSQIWDGPYRTVASALTEWIKYGTFDGSECGHFVINDSGIANEVTTPNCPPGE